VRIAAAGDLHTRAGHLDSRSGDRYVHHVLSAASGRSDLILLAGDLTEAGRRNEAVVVADACGGLGVPVVAVLGNWDAPAVAEALLDAGVVVLAAEGPSHVVLTAAGMTVGIAGVTGARGGFPTVRSPTPPADDQRAIFESAALASGLAAIAGCAIRIALMHYSPTAETLRGERRDLWRFLGSHHLAAPIADSEPDLVVHAHAHSGSAEGRIGRTPVYNVSLPVVGSGFRLIDVSPRPALAH
jgi:Icc-related predicted phosphoesterase